mmetsp:Transcript_18749/g.16599  ORF Transcript_18749/g.16599 Transcript_18749/m.16599 type:complete len:107 (+) Transcript_18749:332-652(+)
MRFSSQDLLIKSSYLFENDEDLKLKLQFVWFWFGMEGDQIPNGLTKDHLEVYLKSIKRIQKICNMMTRYAYCYSTGNKNKETYEIVSKIILFFGLFFVGFFISMDR